MRLGKVCVAVLIATGATGCATGYHSTGMTGGFEETKLADNVYQVRFQGNGYTSQNRASDFLVRRCAELTLEHGKRYFEIVSGSRDATSAGAATFMFSFPSGEATIKTLDSQSDAEVALDAVTIIDETSERAHGHLSPKAEVSYLEFKGEPVSPGLRALAASSEE